MGQSWRWRKRAVWPGLGLKDFIGDDCSLTEYNMSSSYTYICRLGLKGISAVGIKLVWTEEGFIENSREHKDVIHHSCHRTASCPAVESSITVTGQWFRQHCSVSFLGCLVKLTSEEGAGDWGWRIKEWCDVNVQKSAIWHPTLDSDPKWLYMGKSYIYIYTYIYVYRLDRFD